MTKLKQRIKSQKKCVLKKKVTMAYKYLNKARMTNKLGKRTYCRTWRDSYKGYG